MKYKLHLATVSGIPIYLHWSFLLLVSFIVYRGRQDGDAWEAVAMSVLLVFAMFFCVILHELGHAFAAKRYGITTRDIVMYPIGGVAQFNSMLRKPKQELIVALAGPAVNLAIAALLGLRELLLTPVYSLQGSTWNSFFAQLLIVNLFLVAFNMIPAFPMDGGRVLRAVLASKTNRLRATFIAMWVGRFFAMVFVGIGLWSISVELRNYLWNEGINAPTSPFLTLIGFFIYFGAKQEYAMEQHTHHFAHRRVMEVMRAQFTFLLYTDPIQKALDMLFKGTERDFLIGTADGKICGVLSQEALEEAYKNKAADREIRDFVLINFIPLTPHDTVDTAYKRMKKGNFPMLPVVHQNQLLGVVDFATVKLMARFEQ